MSSDPRDPEPDDEDTGPLQIHRPSAPYERRRDDALLPESGLPGDTHLFTPHDTDWPRRFEPLTVTPRPVRRPLKPMIQIVAGALAVVGVGALAFWLFRPSSEPDSAADSAPATTTAGDSPDPEAQTRLLALLPAGYPSGACTPADAAGGALAEVSCEKNSDAGGPLSATYTLVSDETRLNAAFDDSMRSARRVNCPGNIQSPVLCPTGVSNAFRDWCR